MNDFDDSWSVRLASGEVREMDLDQLDAAFEAGVINETTLVLHSAATEWTTLGHLAGIDAAPAPGPSSMAPVAQDLAFDDITEPMEMEFRSRKRGVVVGLVATVMILGGVAFAVTSFGGASTRASGSSSGVRSPEVPATAPTAPPAPVNAEPAKPALTEEQKHLLMEADKQREVREAQRKPKTKAPAPTHRRTKSSSSSPFHTGGNIHDPLNSGP